MKINITKKQYEVLIGALQITGTVYGVMSDMVDKKYKKQSDDLDALEDHILSIADEMGKGDIVDSYEGKRSVDFESMSQYLEDLNEYEEYTFWENLSSKLARREMHEMYDQEKLKTMNEEEHFMTFLKLEEKYLKEFGKHGIERFRITDTDMKIK